MGNVVRPGRAEDPPSQEDRRLSYASPEEIETCLNCPLEKCRGIDYPGCPLGYQKYGERQKKLEQTRDLIKAGATDKFICRELGITPGALDYRKRKLKRMGWIW